MTNDRGRCNRAAPAPSGCGDGWESAVLSLSPCSLYGTAVPAQRAGLPSGRVFSCEDTTPGRSNVWFYTEFG